jgi:hypothetical protein
MFEREMVSSLLGTLGILGLVMNSLVVVAVVGRMCDDGGETGKEEVRLLNTCFFVNGLDDLSWGDDR